MALAEKQKLIANIVGLVLSEQPQTDISFDWFINKHTEENFKDYFNLINEIFTSLNGDINVNQSKEKKFLKCDAFFAGKYNFFFEFDEFQHFSSSRLKTFELYPTNLEVNFSINEWQHLCQIYKDKADKYRKSKEAKDFKFHGGRTAQRAYLDCFRDFLPKQHGLNPTLRINEFEVSGIENIDEQSCKKIELLLKKKLAKRII